MPTSAERITSLVDSESDLKRTVIWLNEAQIFLGPGRLRSETVRRLLIDRQRPVILIGTLWATEYDRLSAVPAHQNDQDFDWDSREILKLARRFTLKDFSAAEQGRAQEISQADPRIAEAVTQSQDSARLTEILAAAPELLSRWQQAANPYGGALISAAVDARVCGHPEPIPLELLETLATVHLSGAQRAHANAEWLTDALQWACEPVRGSAAPISPYAAKIGHLDGYSVSDILVQNRHSTLTDSPIPDRQWDLLVESAAPSACTPLGLAAYTQGHLTHAENAWKRAFRSGDTNVAAPLGLLFYLTGQIEDSSAWWERALEVDGAYGGAIIGRWVYEYGSVDEARDWWHRAVELGGSATALSIGNTLLQVEDLDEARAWWHRAIEIGGSATAAVLGQELFNRGNFGEAHTWWERAIEIDGSPTAITIGEALISKGNFEEARKWWERAVEIDGSHPAATIGYILHERGNLDEARAWWDRAVQLGGAPAALSIGFNLFEDGNLDEARSWWQRGEEVEGPVIAVLLGYELTARGAVEEARAWWVRAAEAGRRDAAALLTDPPAQSEEP
jgi:tetratricopeptide (TPR) repeat protein